MPGHAVSGKGARVMKVTTYESDRRERSDQARRGRSLYPSMRRVYVVVPEVDGGTGFHVRSPRLARSGGRGRFHDGGHRGTRGCRPTMTAILSPRSGRESHPPLPEREEGVADVPMLIDTGADTTLLPGSAVASLGIVGTGERYQLDGLRRYDERVGSGSRRSRLPGQEVSWERYLLIDAEVGVTRPRCLEPSSIAARWPVLEPGRRSR